MVRSAAHSVSNFSLDAPCGKRMPSSRNVTVATLKAIREMVIVGNNDSDASSSGSSSSGPWRMQVDTKAKVGRDANFPIVD